LQEDHRARLAKGVNIWSWNPNFLLKLKLAANFFLFAFKAYVSANQVNGFMICCGHEPGARVIWNARLGPLLKSGNKSALGNGPCNANIAHKARETRDASGGPDPPDCINSAMNIRVHNHPQLILLRAEDLIDFALAVAGHLPETF
jgi:hypothetical protein